MWVIEYDRPDVGWIRSQDLPGSYASKEEADADITAWERIFPAYKGKWRSVPFELKPEPSIQQVFEHAAKELGITADEVNHPKHYTSIPGLEVIDVTEHLNFCMGNSVKYILRADHKGNWETDLKKAIWYLNREIERRKKAEKK